MIIMSKKIMTDQQLSDEEKHILSIASLFEENFSIDWIQELTGLKATEVLSCCEKSAQCKVIRRHGIGSFSFADENIRQSFQALLSSQEKERHHQLIASMFIQDLPDSASKIKLLAPHLLNILNNTQGCNWLMKAAKKYQSDF